MTNAVTIKKATAQAAMEVLKAMIVLVNEEYRRQAMITGHCNTSKTIRPQTRGFTKKGSV